MPVPNVSRVGDEPVIGPAAVPGYGAIFNAGVLRHDGAFHLFARGIRDGYRRNTGPGPRFLDYVSDILVFTSVDGANYQFQQVLASGSSAEGFCYEDPRVQRVSSGGVEHIVMTYTHLPEPSLGEPWRIGTHLLHYRDGRFELAETSGRIVGPDGMENKDAVIFNLSDGRVGLIHRLHPNMQLAVFETLDDLLSCDASYWDGHVSELERHTILRPANDALGIGAGAPPVTTDWGLLLFFHERIADGTYTMNVALLDPHTGRVSAQLVEPVLIPQLPWERFGDVDNVIFVTGAHRFDDGCIYLTYGAADLAVGAAMVHELEVLDALGVLVPEQGCDMTCLLQGDNARQG